MAISTQELLAKIDIPRQKLYYLEQKGFIKPRKKQVGEKEFREYSEKDLIMVEHIWKYLKKGFKYRVAYEKAKEELLNPELDLMEKRRRDEK
jgi:DNA-binding transcriptional MerR regulator